MLADSAEKHGVPIHMHLVETPYQKEYARRRGEAEAPSTILSASACSGPI